jgi:predicted nucleotidyltransferase
VKIEKINRENTMNDGIDLSGTKLGAKGGKAVISFCKALNDAPKINIRSITLYGSAARKDYRPGKSDINLLVILEHIDVPILKSILNPISRARRYRIAPFIMTEKNLRSSADVFPVKFHSMRESFQVLLGGDVLGDLEISREHLRLRCEQEIKNLLLRLRRHFIIGRGRKLRAMMSSMIMGFLENLRIVLSLDEESFIPREEVVDIAAKKFGFDAEILRKVKAFRTLRKKGLLPLKKEPEQLYDKFMGIVEKTAQVIDKMDMR